MLIKSDHSVATRDRVWTTMWKPVTGIGILQYKEVYTLKGLLPGSKFWFYHLLAL